MSENFKIGGVGIDTSGINEIPSSDDIFKDVKYIHTNIGKGNDTMLKNLIPEDAYLITTVNFIDQLDTAVNNHINELGRDKIDLLLIDSNCRLEDYIDDINNLIISGAVTEVGISNPKSVERLEELEKCISKISYVSLDICPLKFPYSIIKYCRENDIMIAGFNPFGGKVNYSRVIASFSIPYLLSFISAYSDIVFLSSYNLENVVYKIEYLSDLIGRNYGKEFVMTQDVDKLLKEPKKAIHTSILIDDSLTVPYDSNEMIFSYPELSFSIGKKSIVFTPQESEEIDLISIVYDYYNSFSGGPADNPTPENTLALLRPKIIELTKLQYPEFEGWITFCTKLSDQAFIISSVRRTEEKKFLRKAQEKIEQVNYLLFYDGEHFVFQNIENANEEG